MLNDPNPLADLDVLPGGIKPTNYHLSIFNIEFGGSWSYEGKVIIAATAQEAVNEIFLHSKGLNISNAEVYCKDDKKQLQSVGIEYLKKDDRVSLKFSEPVSLGAIDITISFKGTIGNSMEGFYRAQYELPEGVSPKQSDDDSICYLLVTQFEPCSARQAFPCFDEPHLKASFELEIELPKNLVALSNMPETSSRLLEGSKEGLKVVSFDKTPVMSTYLAAWTIGDYEYIEAFTEREYGGKRIPVRVYTTKGLKEYGRFALKHACQVLDYYSETFQIDYPLPKCDHVVVHEFVSGAMENWGLITYKPTKILFDESTSDSKLKNKAAYVVAHELAHQWFGNLVTMNTWAELWLNEGFATWAAYLAVDHLYPEWQFWSQFVAEVMQEAFALDSLEASHPIEVNVESTAEAIQMFDSISYFKGSSVIRMLSDHVGQDVFLQGVSKYLKRHSYRNASSTDLWTAISETSGQDVHGFMYPWIRKIGFPLVTITECNDRVTIDQQRFLASGKAENGEESTIWNIPLGICGNDEQSHQVMTEPNMAAANLDLNFYKFNRNTSGFYHTFYPSNRLLALGQLRTKLSVEDRAGLIGEVSSLVFAGKKRTSELLQFLQFFQDDDSYFVWSQISKSLSVICSVFYTNKSIMQGLRTFITRLIVSATPKVKWDIPRDDYVTGEFRKTILDLAAGVGDEAIVGEAKRRFSGWQRGKLDEVDPNLRSVIFSTAIVNGSNTEYEAVKQEYLRTLSIDGKEICLNAMGRTTEPAQITDLLDFMLSENVPLQNVNVAAGALGRNGGSRYRLWEYIKTNWAAVHSRLSSNDVVLNWTIQHGLSHFSDFELEDDILAFFADKDTEAFASGIRVVRDSIRRNASYKARDEAELLQWLQSHNFI